MEILKLNFKKIDWATKNGKTLTKLGNNYLKTFKGAGIIGSSYATYNSYLEVKKQYKNGGLNNVFKNNDIIDLGINGFTTGVQGAALFGVGVNPIVLTGTGILSIGYGVYFESNGEIVL